MKKRKKKRNPEKTAANKALKEWRERALRRAGSRCEWCGDQKKGLNCHHIITKKVKELRFDDLNSLILCARCHKFGLNSAHNNPIKVCLWLMKYRLDAWKYLADYITEREVI